MFFFTVEKRSAGSKGILSKYVPLILCQDSSLQSIDIKYNVWAYISDL